MTNTYQVVEYDKHKDLTGHIKAQFGREPFDLIFDCIGSESLYTNSPGYLSKKGTFISIAAGVSQGMAEILRYKLRPICLGGTPRQYRIITLTNNGDLARRAIARYTTGSVVNCPIDSEFDMDHVVEVRSSSSFLRMTIAYFWYNWLIINCYRHTKSSPQSGHVGRF